MSDPQEGNFLSGDAEHEPQPARVSPGAKLAAYRQEHGWTIEQVASQLNLAPRQIVAIESDDYPALPGMAITRGFIRAYAKLLKVDAAPLLADLGGETVLSHESIAPRKSLATPFSKKSLPNLAEPQALSSKWVIGLLLAILLGVAFWALRQGGAPIEISMPSMQSKGEAQPIASAETSVPSVPEKDAEPSLSSAPGSSESSANLEPAAAPGVSPAPPETVTEAAPSTLSAEGKDTLVLKIRQESWLEIKRGDRTIVARLAKAGETETLEVTEPISLVVGNVAGVDASLRGTAIELKSGNKNSNVARLTLK